jgi:hypothetical protein
MAALCLVESAKPGLTLRPKLRTVSKDTTVPQCPKPTLTPIIRIGSLYLISVSTHQSHLGGALLIRVLQDGKAWGTFFITVNAKRQTFEVTSCRILNEDLTTSHLKTLGSGE